MFAAAATRATSAASAAFNFLTAFTHQRLERGLRVQQRSTDEMQLTEQALQPMPLVARRREAGEQLLQRVDSVGGARQCAFKALLVRPLEERAQRIDHRAQRYAPRRRLGIARLIGKSGD